MPHSNQTAGEPLLQVRGLKKYFPLKAGFLSRQRRFVKAVDGVSLDLMENETVGLVGESGCGKSTAGRSILRLIEPTEGEILFRGQDICKLNNAQLRGLRRQMQIIFQDPFSSLNPRMTIEQAITDAVRVHGILRDEDALHRLVRDLLERVGLQPSYASRYPHEFSGGQRQRIGIARALALRPSFIVCDEAVSALDVSVQAQVINLLEDLQSEYKLSYLFIAHDLSVVRHISQRICVMYLGQIIEASGCDGLFDEPLHPYTQALLSAVPHPNPNRKRKRIILKGDVPSPLNPPTGCRFHTRCPLAFDACKLVEPRPVEVERGHTVRCHLYDRNITQVPKESLLQARDTCRALRADANPNQPLTAEREQALWGRPGFDL
jgi:oligopeptide/dipeptide ABC transporter ATP-binding protein